MAAGIWRACVERNAQIPAAPTGKPASERRPAFPYLEATGARINFKLGQTKKSYALIECRRGALAGLGEFLGRARQG